MGKKENEEKTKKSSKRHFRYPIIRKGLCAEMISLIQQSVELFNSLPMRLVLVEEQLDKADKLFKENAFVPFWEAIETAARLLAEFNGLVNSLKEKASRYGEITRLYDNDDAQRDMDDQTIKAIYERPPNDPIVLEIKRLTEMIKRKEYNPPPPTQHKAIESLRIAMLGHMYKGEELEAPPPYPITPQCIALLNEASKKTVSHMESLVQAAHRNFQFASIYEQRRTNQILIAGFTNLAEALNKMTYKIAASISDLAISIGAMSSVFNESLESVNTDLRKALEMLDNIQRGRRPFP